MYKIHWSNAAHETKTGSMIVGLWENRNDWPLEKIVTFLHEKDGHGDYIYRGSPVVYIEDAITGSIVWEHPDLL